MTEIASGLRRCGLRIGLVPTMGALHAGHLSLVRDCVARCDVTLVSIFVNPTQFGPQEDFASYPRAFAEDCRLCRQHEVDFVFSPSAEDMYSADRSVSVRERQLSTVLCGRSRPGHFDGVCTVVAKLFNLVRPDLAFFGKKDAQQLAVIRRMVRDLNFQVEVVGVPIVREPDGLAMSSRNLCLSPASRQQALGLSRALDKARAEIDRGLRDVAKLQAGMLDLLHKDFPLVQAEYIAFVDGETLQPVAEAEPGTLVAIAARVGPTRLIDNMEVTG